MRVFDDQAGRFAGRPSVPGETHLDERSQQVLKAVVETYIETIEPVGSRTLTKKHGFGLSPATIRNIMADLEEMGFLIQPHTSAGRMPTEKGYRFYVNHCVTGSASFAVHENIDARDRVQDLKRDATTIVQEVTQELSHSSQHLGVAVAPRFSHSRLSRVELIPVKGTVVQAVIITEEGVVRNLLLDLGQSYNSRHLATISGFVNKHLHGYTLQEARDQMLRALMEQKAACDALMSQALRIGQEIVAQHSEDRVFVKGMSEALHKPGVMNMTTLREIFRAIEDHHLLIRVFNMVEEMEAGVQVLIGSENPVNGMQDCAMIMSPYQKRGRVIGSIGVIGPIEMDYPKVINMVDQTARFLSRVFSMTEEEKS